jgi:hypothetical protein
MRKKKKKIFTKLEIRQEKKSLKNDSERNEGGGSGQVRSGQIGEQGHDRRPEQIESEDRS